MVGGVLGLAAGLGLGFAYHDRLPAESAAAPVVVPAPDRPARGRTRPPAEAARDRAERFGKVLAEQEAREKGLAAEIARREAEVADLPAVRADLDWTRRRLAELDRPVAPPASPADDPAPADDAEVKALRAKKAQLAERLGPEHRDMLALDEEIRAAERRAARPKSGGPAVAPPNTSAIEAERAGLAARAAVRAGRVAEAEATLAEVQKLKAERDKVAAVRADVAARLAPPEAEPAQPVPPSAEPARAPATAAVAAKPPLWQSLLPGGLLGLLGGAGLGYLAALLAPVAAYRDPRPAAVPAPRPARPAKAKNGPPDDAAVFGMPVLARVPQLRTDLPPERRSGEGWDPVLVAFSRPTSAEAEAFRAARRGIAAALQNRGHQVVLVTSPGPGDGKTTLAANLALSLAQAGKRVILVDCDLRTPGVQNLFKLGRPGDGLRSVMTADVDLRLAVRECEVGNLFLLPVGRGAMDPVDLLTRPKFRELVAELRARYEYVLFDAPPATAAAELRALAEYADGAVLAVRAGDDAATRAGWASGQVAAAGAKVLGLVLNAAPAPADPVTGGPTPAATRTDQGLTPLATGGRPSGTPADRPTA